MALMPEDIQSKTFKEKYKGYDVDEVDEFLDQLTERLSDLLAENSRLQERVGYLESVGGVPSETAPAPVPEPTPAPAPAAAPAQPEGFDPDLLQRTLLTAQRAADETLAAAQSEADQLVADAQAESDRVVSEAQAQAQEHREKLRSESAKVAQAVEDLRRFRNEYTERARGVIAEHLALLDRAGELPEMPVEIEDAASAVHNQVNASTAGDDTPWPR